MDNKHAIPGYPGYYITPDAHVFRRLKDKRSPHYPWRPLKAFLTTYGYLRVAIIGPNGPTQVEVHRLVALTFIGPPQQGQVVVRHLNGVKTDNRIENLAWGTFADNAKDAVRLGETLRGQNNPRAKLTDDIVLQIRAAASRGRSLTSLAKEHGVAFTAVRLLVHRKTWRHI